MTIAPAMHAWASTGAGLPLECIECPAPAQPQGAGVVVEVTHCGVCHSDVHFWEGFIDAGDRKIPIEALGIARPLILGHEIVGRVVAAGPEATTVKPGDIRLVYPWIGCGDCADCAAGDDHLCTAPRSLGIRRSGGFGSHVEVPHERYLLDFGNLDPALAATYACSGLTVFSAIRKIMPQPRDAPVVLIGAGGLGLNAIAVLRALGHRNIVSLDPSAGSRAAAESLGARALDSGREDIGERLAEAAGGPVKAIIDLVNNSDTAALAVRSLARGGKLVMVGMFGGTLTIPLAPFPASALTIMGNFVGSLGDLHALIALAQTGEIPAIPITRRPRGDANAALEAVRNGEMRGRIVLDASL
ncbi:MAG: alcohol dehydrogenase [Oricola sp.]